MKTKIKRHSRSVISVILAVCMLISCMTAAMIATDAAKVEEDSTVGWNSSTDKFHYHVKPSGGSWEAEWHDAAFSSAGVATFTIAANDTEIEFELVFNGTTYKYDSSQSQFTASQMRKTNGTESRAKSNGNGTFKTTGVYAGTYTVTLIGTPNNGEQRFKISGEGSGPQVCSIDQKYVVVGEQHLTNLAAWQNSWDNATSRNQMVYDSTIEMYKVVYTNIAASTTGFKFRIVKENTWDNFRAYNQATLIDDANIATISNSSDNNSIKMTLSQKANITITYTDANVDGSSDSTKSVTITVSPAVSNVTAGTCTGGTVTVTGGTNVAYGNSVGLTATPAANYHFKNWVANDKLVYASATSATTSANVYGTTEVTALFEGDSFNITKASDNYTMTAPANAQYNTEVTISATPADGYILDSVWYSTDGGTTKTTAANGKFTMPASNVTVGAVVHPKSANTINYGVVNGQTGWGYVSVGEKYNTNTTIKRTIANGSSVYEDVSVNFGARPAEGYKFVGWYPNPDGSGEQIDDSQDYNVTGPSGNYYAKFAAAAVDPLLPASNAIRLMVRATGSAANDSSYVYAYHKVNNNNTELLGGWGGKAFTALSGTKTYNGNTYYYYDFANTNSLVIILNDSSGQTANIVNMENGKTYILTYSGGTNKTDDDWGYSGTTDPDIATTTYYPIVLNVENGEYGTTYTNTFAEKSKTFTVNHTPDAEHKAALEKTGYTGNAGSTSTTLTMPDEYAAANKVTVTYNEKQYYPVNFSAGPNGSIKAWIGNSTYSAENAIKSGTKIKEGETVYFEATPKNSSYAVDSWVGFSGTSTTNNLTVDGDENVKVFFKYSDDGEAVLSDGPYFRWDHGNTVSNWAQIKVKDGRAFGYIDNPGNGGGDGDWWCFSVADDKTGTDHIWTDSNVTCVTDFDQYVQVSTYNTAPKLGMARVKSGKPVSRLIIDLGSWNGTSFSLDYNTFRVIPVYDTDNTNIDVYAKKGSYRGDSQYDYFPGIVSSSTLTITSATNAATNVEHHANFATGCAKPGDTVNFSVTINNDHKDAFYIRGFSINGVTPALYDWNSSGTYSVEYTIPANFNYDYLEITPIYYYRHDNETEGSDFVDDNFVQFYIENYDKALEATGWGNTLSVYPYYQDSSGNYVKSKQNAFGGYPGQPVIYYGGRRFIEIPTHYSTFPVDNPSLTTQVVCDIKGVTLSNDYWDIVHRQYCHEVSEHKQTYDYDDFYKIFKETHDGQEVNDNNTGTRTHTADQITFAFKYRTETDNFSENTSTHLESNYAAGSTSGQIPDPWTSFTNAEKTSKFGNGWEDLLDYMDRPIDIFGKQLTPEEQQREPLLIVSDDYRITYAGYYATTWTIYKKNADGTGYEKLQEIAPSALIVTSSDRLVEGEPYPHVEDQYNITQTTLTDYSDEYEALEQYRGYPAQITFESAIRNNSGTTKYFNVAYTEDGQSKYKSSEDAVRNDGRWYYSYYNDTIHANIRIEYKNDESDDAWTVDPFKGDSNQGTVTGGKVYFTNRGTSYEGKTETGDVTSNQNAFYQFAAEAAPGYVFAGWWFEKDNIVTDVNADHSQLTGQSQMTSNATFVARYIKNPSGNLTINHTIADGSVGEGTTYVKVEAINKSNNATTVLTNGTGSVSGFMPIGYTIGSDYVSYKSGYKFKITLKTTTNNQFTLFDRFSAASDESADYFSTANQATSDNATTTYFEVDVDDMFAINAKGFPEQQFDTLSYFSYLKAPTYTYELNYSYPSYDNLYGDQGYTVSGTFSYDDLMDFMTLSGSTLTFKATSGETNYKVNFLERSAPYEDNFMQTIAWNSSTATESFNNNKLTVTISPDPSTSKEIELTLVFPYAHSNYANKYAPTVTEGRILKAADIEEPVTPNLQYNEVFSFSEVKTYGGETEPDVLEAPAEIFEAKGDGTFDRHIFRYWSLKTVDEAKRSSMEYTRGYSQKLNLVLFQNTIATPVYTLETSASDRVNPQAQQKADEEKGITITFIENSRNQYNENQCGSITNANRQAQGDRIYSDFLLSFNNVAKNSSGDPIQLNTLAANTMKAGLIIETVGDIDIDSTTGQYITKTEAQYQGVYGNTLTDISSKLSGKDSQGNTVTVDREEQLKSFINNSSNDLDGKLLKSEFDVTQLDNKNRVQFYYSLPNKSHSTMADTERRFKVYRAYAYFCDNSHSTASIQISSTPVYFTIYDIGSIQSYAEATQTGGYKS